MRRWVTGFSLVEVLVVLSLVAVLASVAFPTWKRSKTLSTVAESRQDLLEIHAALESFFADHQYYPEDHDSFPNPSQAGLFRLTSPVAYLSSGGIFTDRFTQDRVGGPVNYEGGGGCSPLQPIRPLPSYFSPDCVPAYLLIGSGPDRVDSTSSNDSFPFNTRLVSYNPTNGIESRGDIYRIAGSYEQGDFLMDGVQVGGGN